MNLMSWLQQDWQIESLNCFSVANIDAFKKKQQKTNQKPKNKHPNKTQPKKQKQTPKQNPTKKTKNKPLPTKNSQFSV